MAGSYGDFVARTVQQGDVSVPATAWVPLTSSGTNGVTTSTSPMVARRHVRYQIKANPGGALAVMYVAKNADGTFSTPAANTNIKTATVFPGNTTIVEPIGDSVQVFGRLSKKKGFTYASIRVIVTEFS